MGQVMRQAVQMDDKRYCSVKERLAQLEVMRLFSLLCILWLKKLNDEGHKQSIKGLGFLFCIHLLL